MREKDKLKNNAVQKGNVQVGLSLLNSVAYSNVDKHYYLVTLEREEG